MAGNGGSDSEWTVETLRQMMMQLFTEHGSRDENRFQAGEAALRKAEHALELRFESVNEFRAQLSDQSATFLTRIEYEAKHAALQARFDGELEALTTKADLNTSRLDRIEGRSRGANAGWAVLVAAVVAITAVVGAVTTLIVAFQ